MESAKTLDEFLARRQVSASGLSSPASLKILADQAKLDFLVLGTIEKEPHEYELALKILHLPDGDELAAQASPIPRTAFIDSLSDPFPPKTDYPIYKVGVEGISWPSCVRCPDPPYNSFAREQRIEGVSVFQAIVSPDGRIAYAHPVKLLGYGLDEQAYDVIKTWRFKPATNKRHEPVAVIVPIEVTFRVF